MPPVSDGKAEVKGTESITPASRKIIFVAVLFQKTTRDMI